MTYGEIVNLFACILVVQTLALFAAIVLAVIAVIEARRLRLVAAARDPLWNADADDALAPWQRGLVERLRQWGAL